VTVRLDGRGLARRQYGGAIELFEDRRTAELGTRAEQLDSTTVLAPGQSSTVESHGHLIVELVR
jgi:hypothetical protein